MKYKNYELQLKLFLASFAHYVSTKIEVHMYYLMKNTDILVQKSLHKILVEHFFLAIIFYSINITIICVNA